MTLTVKDYIEAIKGVPAPDYDNPPVRMEVRDMNPKMWELYVLGLQKFQEVDMEKSADEHGPLSFFKIAGIHGIPHERWPLEDWNKHMEPKDGKATRGFCTHSSILFLPWHRPYLALFEHELYKWVQDVATEAPYSEDPEYAELAKSFRIPYWDWADPKREIFPPKAMQNLPVNELFPGCKLEHNPLASYKFPEGIPAEYKVRNYPRTVRWAMKDWVDGGDNKQAEDLQQAALEKFLKHAYKSQQGNNITERVSYVLKSYDSFRAMSNNSLWGDDKNPQLKNYGSFEDPHNVIHNFTGGFVDRSQDEGQMRDTKYSAFDPIFWLHHANLDRLLAMWQVLHPESYVVPAMNMDGDAEDENAGTWTHGVSEESTDTTLTPFFITDESTFYKADDCKKTKEFGYTYPELVGDPTKEQLVDTIDKIYPTGSVATLVTRKHDIASGAVSKVISHAKAHKALADYGSGPLPIEPVPLDGVELPQGRLIDDIVSGSRYLEWLVNIKAQKHALAGKYEVHVFLGQPDDSDPREYLYSPNHVSFFAPFGQDRSTSCGKCQDDQARNLTISGQIPLTLALLERYLAGLLPSLTTADVVPYLTDHLQWRVTGPTGAVIPQRSVDGLTVAVVSNEVVLPSQPGELPDYSSTVRAHPEITAGRGDGTGYTIQTA